jgi:hypothetical protein
MMRHWYMVVVQVAVVGCGFMALDACGRWIAGLIRWASYVIMG